MLVTILWLLTAMSALGVVLFALWMALFLRNCPVLWAADTPPTDAPLISVVVPARNEAANIERCLRSILAQTYVNLEVIAVDDSSTDATPRILARLAAQDPRLQVLAGEPLPPGWTGKNHAVYQGVLRARGSWLLFVDADVMLSPSTLAAAYRTARERGVALLTLWARQELVSFWERTVQPVVIGMNLVVDPWQRVSNMRHLEAFAANGQFLLIDRAAYEQVGGHAAVRDQVVEDQQLARRIKLSGMPILMMDGSRLISTRMYASLREIWEGWSKNNFLTMDRRLLLTLGSVLATYFVAVGPFALMIWSLVGFKFSQQLLDPLVVNLLMIALLLWTRWRIRSFCGTPLRDYLWHPIGGLLFMGIMLNSAYLHTWGRGATWKGRRYRKADPVA